MLHQPALLLSRFELNKAHGRSPDRLADCLSIGGIVLVALDVRLHVLRRHQPHLVTEFHEFARPIMGRGARLHTDKAPRKALKNAITLLRRSCFLTTTFSVASIP